MFSPVESTRDSDSFKRWRSLSTTYVLSINRDRATNLSAGEENIRVDGMDMCSTDTLGAEESSIKMSSTNEANAIIAGVKALSVELTPSAAASVLEAVNFDSQYRTRALVTMLP